MNVGRSVENNGKRPNHENKVRIMYNQKLARKRKIGNQGMHIQEKRIIYFSIFRRKFLFANVIFVIFVIFEDRRYESLHGNEETNRSS